jgi:hypothetical protein
MKKFVFIATMLIASCTAGLAQTAEGAKYDCYVFATGVLTTPSPGRFTSGPSRGMSIFQTNRNGGGAGTQCLKRFKKNIFGGVEFSTAPTNSKLTFPTYWFAWPLSRAYYSLVGAYRLPQVGRYISPYLTDQVGGVLLNGGPKESGLDGIFTNFMGAGVDIRLFSRTALRIETDVDPLWHAPTYQDQTYISSKAPVAMFKVGLSHDFDLRKKSR